MSHDLDDRFLLLCQHEMGLVGWLRPNAPGRKHSRCILVEAVTVAHVQRSGHDRDDPVIWVRVRLDFRIGWEFRSVDVDAFLAIVTQDVGARVSSSGHRVRL
ncbi:MAG: hypothetical protein QM712_16865 [Bradyrhizobium sp.]